LNTPVVLIVFNRPRLAEKVFESIASARPAKLFLIADGPRFAEEAGECLSARAVIERIDWDCDLTTNFADSNLGCRERIVSGLDWVFTQVDEAIVLEDDCVPHPSFFHFCQTMLSRYRDDERVMEIGGGNYQGGHSRTTDSYYFSKYSHTHGWATWGRAWEYFGELMSDWQQIKGDCPWDVLCENDSEYQYWTEIYEQISSGKLTSSWDYQWQLARYRHGGLTIVPNANLVSNIGYGKKATHTRWKWQSVAALPTQDIGDLCHPATVMRNEEADQYMFQKVFKGNLLQRAYRMAKHWRDWARSVR
jgi:hypothetical protein